MFICLGLKGWLKYYNLLKARPFSSAQSTQQARRPCRIRRRRRAGSIAKPPPTHREQPTTAEKKEQMLKIHLQSACCLTASALICACSEAPRSHIAGSSVHIFLSSPSATSRSTFSASETCGPPQILSKCPFTKSWVHLSAQWPIVDQACSCSKLIAFWHRISE